MLVGCFQKKGEFCIWLSPFAPQEGQIGHGKEETSLYSKVLSKILLR
jgi:hypothetical protein